MIFLSLLGLLGLLGIVALIIIYVIKPKYQEQSVSSSFIWKLSLKYKKRKLPFEWFKSSLLIILQVIILLLLTLIMMKPNWIKDVNAIEQVIILDTSASMLAEKDGETRLEKAIDQILERVEETIENDEKVTLIISGDTNDVLAHRSTSIEFIKQELANIESTYTTSDIEGALQLSEDVLNLNPNAEVVVYTSTYYPESSAIKVINVSDDEWNIAILDFKGEYDLSLNYVFTIEVASYGKATNDTILQLDLDGVRENSVTLDLPENEIVTYQWKVPGVNASTYNIATLSLLEANDSFIYDNSLSFYSVDNTFNVQLFSPEQTEGFNSTVEYTSRAIQALQRPYSIDYVDDETLIETQGYDLYIYVDHVPNDLPQDGPIWIFNPDSLPTQFELSIGSDLVVDNETLSIESSLSEDVTSVIESIRPELITVSRYKSVSNDDNYETLLKIGNDPVLLTNTINGVKVTVFTFSLEYSNLPILFYDFPVLIRNLSNYSVIPTIDKEIYNGGETIKVNTNPLTEKVIVTNENGSKEYEFFPLELDKLELGIHQITEVYSDGREVNHLFYVRIPKIESQFDLEGEELLPPIVEGIEVPVDQSNQLQDIIIIFAIGLLIIALIEWEVQYREQY